MKAIFWTRVEKDLVQTDRRETDLALAVQEGAKLSGDTIEIREMVGDPVVEDVDLMLGCGCKGRDWYRAYNAAGIPYAYFDKGYIRSRSPTVWLSYWRVSVNGHQPLAYVDASRHDSKRADEMELVLNPWRAPRGDALVVDGSSGKHCYFHADREFTTKQELNDYANSVAFDLVAKIKKKTKRPIIYRPKPSWSAAKPIPGTEFARDRPRDEIKDWKLDFVRAHAVVTYGSNLCFDAACFGVPSIVLGNGIAKSISSTSLDEIETPRLATEEERRQWLNNCAWCQFKLEEFREGVGWKAIKEMIECTPIS